MQLSRRSFFLGAGALVAAPSIVSASSLMPVRVPKFVPEPWLVCDGRAVLKREYAELFARIGSMFGGDGLDRFNLPDLRSSFARPSSMLEAEYVKPAQYVVSTTDQAARPAGTITMWYAP